MIIGQFSPTKEALCGYYTPCNHTASSGPSFLCFIEMTLLMSMAVVTGATSDSRSEASEIH